MSQGLPISDVVKVDVNVAPQAAQTRSFGSLLILGATDVLLPADGLRAYAGIEGVSADFGVADPEYAAAEAFFAQSPKPTQLYIGRWAKNGAPGALRGGVLSGPAQAIDAFTPITAGTLTLAVDGADVTASTIDLSGAVNLNGVAAAVTAALSGATVVWAAAANRFEVVSQSTGDTSTVGPAADGNLADLMGLTEGNAAPPIPGLDPESAAAAVTRAADASSAWYGLTIADTGLTDDDVLEVAAFIEAAAPVRIFGHTITDANALSPTSTTDLAATLAAAGYARTFTQYCSTNAAAVNSLIGRAFTTDYTGANTVITLKFKQEPGVTPEVLTQTAAGALKAKNCNVFVAYNNATAILQEGVMANGDFFDERHGFDWLANYVQTAQYNFLYQATTKVPLTDPGVNMLLTNVEASMAQAVANGLIAPGVWQSSTVFGALKTGDTLPKGYYAYAPPVATLSAADRGARRAPTIQVAAKLASAVHYSHVIIDINR
jgi:hypothetical protein